MALAILTLNRPDKMNSLSDQLLADFRAAMDACEHDDSVRAMIITGSGKAFSRLPCRTSVTMPRAATRRGCGSGARAYRLRRR